MIDPNSTRSETVHGRNCESRSTATAQGYLALGRWIVRDVGLKDGEELSVRHYSDWRDWGVETVKAEEGPREPLTASFRGRMDWKKGR